MSLYCSCDLFESRAPAKGHAVIICYLAIFAVMDFVLRLWFMVGRRDVKVVVQKGRRGMAGQAVAVSVLLPLRGLIALSLPIR